MSECNEYEITGEGGFLSTRQFTQVPIDGLISTVVGGSTEGDLGNDIGSVGRNGNLQFDALSRDLLAEVGNDLDVDLERSSTLQVIQERYHYHSLTISSYTGKIRKGKLMFSVTRYFMSSNSPSGGMKVMVRSWSN